jgi:hypothetical protein
MSVTTAEIVTPTIRRATRRWLFWIVVAVFAVLVALASITITGTAGTAGTPYSPTDASPTGSKALAQVLRQQGVHVSSTDTLEGTHAALAAHRHSTLMLVDPNGYLSQTQLRSLAALAQHVVLLAPGYAELSALAPQVDQGGTVPDKPLSAGCGLPAAVKAGTIGGKGIGYRIVDTSSPAIACYGSGDGVFSVVDITQAGRRTTLVGATAAFANGHVAEHGDAALALNLLGDNGHLVWYLPSVTDIAVQGGPTIAQLTPLWVSPVIVLLIITAIAAAVWRGRRMGPLVIENLPVAVRASETMEGRARLYQRGAARLRALDALRIGTIGRLATLCGLPRQASVDEAVSTVADLTGRDRGGIRQLLIDTVPTTDRQLVDLSDELQELERATARAIRPRGE